MTYRHGENAKLQEIYWKVPYSTLQDLFEEVYDAGYETGQNEYEVKNNEDSIADIMADIDIIIEDLYPMAIIAQISDAITKLRKVNARIENLKNE